jgi:hypothetical protein
MNRHLILLLAALPLTALAQTTYKWKDANGQLHFSQTPPKDQKYETVGAPPPPASNPNQDALNKSLEADRREAPKREQAEQLAAQQQAQRQENCRKAIERVAFYDSHPPRKIRAPDEQGGMTPMTEDAWARERAGAQDRVREYCD